MSDIRTDLEASVKELLDEYKDRLMAEALRLCADEASAEDLVMRTFEVYLFKREKYDPQRGSMLAWLRAVMRNLQTDSLRRRKVDEVVMSPDEIERLIDAQLPAELQEDAERAAMEERALSEAVNALSPKIREAVVLHYFESLPVAEVARQLRVSENSIKNRLFYARKVLTKRLKGKLGKKPLAVLAVLLFGITALFGAYQLAKVEEVEEGRSGILSASEQDEPSATAPASVTGDDVLVDSQTADNASDGRLDLMQKSQSKENTMNIGNRVGCCLAIASCGATAAVGAALDCVDISGETARHSVVAAGTSSVFNGQPSTILLPDGKTMFCFWTINHGGRGGPVAKSDDGGLTWSRIDDQMPQGIDLFVECPMAHRLVDAEGHARLWAWYGFKARNEQEAQSLGGASPARIAAAQTTAAMPSVMSEDDGVTWREMSPLGEKFRCVLSFQGIVRLTNGTYLGVFHRGAEACVDRSPLEVLSSTSADGGQTWSEPKVIAAVSGLDLCEPWVFRSPDGRELAVLMRENTRKGRSKVIFSTDEGDTWSQPQDVPLGLTGDRHQGVLLQDGRLVVCFRDMEEGSATWGHYVAWIGPYAVLHGQASAEPYRVKLFHSFAGSDCGYSGVHLLPDDTIVCTTYVKYRNDSCKNSVMTTRFKVAETDAMRAAIRGTSVRGESTPISSGSVTNYTSLSYVQDGLAAQWDGIENAGRFRHADELSEWKDLVGNGTISIASGTVSVGPASVTVLNNKRMDGVCSELANDTPKTIEVCWRCVKNGVNSYVFVNDSHKFIGNNDGSSYLTYDDGANHRVYLNGPANDSKAAHTFSCGYPGNAFSFGYDGHVTELGLQRSQDKPRACQDTFRLGANDSGRDGSYEYYSIRVYSRVLTAEEIRHNHEVDVARFKEGRADWRNTLLVDGRPEPFGTVVPAYGYYQGLSGGMRLDCSAKAPLPLGQTNFVCSGYVVYTNGVYGAGREYLHGSESSFRYVQPDNALAELVWQWDKREDPTLPNVVGVSAVSENPDELVVRGNLVAMTGTACELSVVVRGEGLPEPLVFERLAGSVRTETGEFEIKVVTDDPDAPNYLHPDKSYEVEVLARTGEKSSRSLSTTVKMYLADFSSMSYVQDGLAAQWDGIENAGRSRHADELSEWKDLVGDGTISIAFGTVSVGPASVTVLNNKRMDGVCSELANDTPKTIEVCWRCVKNGVNSYVFVNDSHKFIGNNGGNSFLTYDDGADHRVYLNGPVNDSKAAHTFSCGYPGNDFSFGYDGHVTELGLQQRVNKPRACQDTFRLGANDSGRDGSYEYRSIRIYSRVLSQGEIRQNWWIDRIRYDGVTSEEILPTGTRVLADGTIQYRTEIDARDTGVRFDGVGGFAKGVRVWWKSLSQAKIEAEPKSGCRYAWVGAPQKGAAWSDDGATLTWNVDGTLSIYLDVFSPSDSVRHIAPGETLSLESLRKIKALHIGALQGEAGVATCQLCGQVEIAAANGGYAIVEAKGFGKVRSSVFTLLRGGKLKLLADAIINDLEMPDAADTLDLNGHKLTIRSMTHKDRAGWEGTVVDSAGGGQIVWDRGPGLVLMVW